MAEQKSKDGIEVLVKFVDDNFRPTSITDIFVVFPQLHRELAV